MTVTLPADDLQVHSITLPVMLPFYAGPLYAIHHLYAASTGPARYQCVASTTSIHLQQFENNRDHCAVANAGTMAHAGSMAIELNLHEVHVEIRTSRRSCITRQNHYTTVQLTVVTS